MAGGTSSASQADDVRLAVSSCAAAPRKRPFVSWSRTAGSGREATIVNGHLPAYRVSDIRLLGDFQRIIDFDAKVPDRILQLGVTQQQLHRPQVLCPAVD